MSADAAPVLFLDLDDVLCLNTPYGGFDVLEVMRGQHDSPGKVYRHLFAPGACDVLRQVHLSTGGTLRYVISSSWRQFFGRDSLQQLFARSGLDFVAAAMHEADRWCTPLPWDGSRRADEIAAWLDRHHRGGPFAIVDDTFSGPSLQPALTLADHPFHGRVVLCQERVGLCDVHVLLLADALGRPSGVAGAAAGAGAGAGAGGSR